MYEHIRDSKETISKSNTLSIPDKTLVTKVLLVKCNFICVYLFIYISSQDVL